MTVCFTNEAIIFMHVVMSLICLLTEEIIVHLFSCLSHTHRETKENPVLLATDMLSATKERSYSRVKRQNSERSEQCYNHLFTEVIDE